MWTAWNIADHLKGPYWVGICNTGALSASQGKLTAQGKLLQQDTFYVTEQDSGVQSRPKERRVFLFEQIVIFSELLRKGSLTPGYMFKKSIKVRNGVGDVYPIWLSHREILSIFCTASQVCPAIAGQQFAENTCIYFSVHQKPFKTNDTK